MKLLDTSGGNAKLKKNNQDKTLRVAGLSLLPNKQGCPFMYIAGCGESCLRFSGRGIFKNVEDSRQSKLDHLNSNRAGFISDLVAELKTFSKYCAKRSLQGYVRLNVLQDYPWHTEAYGAIPQQFPELLFFDYTKVATRLGKTPDNYQLMFSYSPATAYQKSVELALKTDVPISVVFNGDMPSEFLGRKVYDGDKSDIDNLTRKGAIIGLKYKLAKGQSVDPLDSKFIVTVT
jgi:hypothetical protein|tara:strand:- start:292 stop:987 length:696 start_codon:yes stop_codon:yes gene_type:complete